MSVITLLQTIAKKRLSPQMPKPQRTRTPLRLSQESAVRISITPLILAEEAGALFKSDLPTDGSIIAVGQSSLLGLTRYHAYLSQSDGAYIHLVTRGDELIETRLYRRYDEVVPGSSEEWAFWLADDDGYIGLPIMQSKDTDGGIQYQRTWNNNDRRISPYHLIETLVGATGFTTTMRHRLMHYSRVLTDPRLSEHLLVSVVETDEGASVNFWVGIDITTHDLTVFASADAPL